MSKIHDQNMRQLQRWYREKLSEPVMTRVSDDEPATVIDANRWTAKVYDADESVVVRNQLKEDIKIFERILKEVPAHEEITESTWQAYSSSSPTKKVKRTKQCIIELVSDW